ncbi:MAG: alpha/beta-type small acid-soluble spore protein [Clostridia bacterium]|nr:alpha/beta-type small acid-soluble spore protein [Clostridia bacterium]MBQ2517946.1 alpha/beta-type small acid-soluble spore protein [Clostridia bacterium]MBQ4341731.1 alpha/beta-type small acid-soluble spore protein [Clostridia bacterium]MBR6428998.1 alpha/beta-type small acid-soluble spore protein [Clostridia bacterium]
MAKKNRASVPEAKQSMDRFKTEVANSIGVDLENSAGSLTTREAGSVGGEMVKRMIRYAEDNMSDK